MSIVMPRCFKTASLIALSIFLSACDIGGGRGDAAQNPDPTVTPSPVAGNVRMRVGNALPPGQSGHFSAAGQVQGTAVGTPASFGEHIDDQRELYWRSEFKAGEFQDISGRDADVTPKDGVNIYFDEYGVPAVYADTVFDLWFGAGYIMAQQRLFLLDGVRRQATGTLAELTGPGTVPQDMQARVTGYSAEEYQRMFDDLSETSQQAALGYVDGVNQRINEVLLNPTLLPAEYAVLSSLPQEISVADVLAAGVLMTRFVASEGGNEMENVISLKRLQSMHGEEIGRKIFQDIFWVDDKKAAVSIPPSEGVFNNITTPLDQREAVFQAQADFAASLPDELQSGAGTGDYPEPLLGTLAASKAIPVKKDELPDPAAQAAAYFAEFLRGLHGGSYMAVVAGSKTDNGMPLLINGPQLGHSYPSLLAEIEVHGAGFHARGATVPGLPVVGIGYGQRIAWGLTTGYSKTIDSFIEDTSVGDSPNEYLHNGEVKSMDCRDETVSYRQAPEGVPAGPPIFSVTEEVCRTVHGPVVARSNDGQLARSVQYAMWQREVETIEGVIGWQQAQNLDEFLTAMRKVTWNENTMYIDADGNIAYFHPGLHPLRAPNTDLRFPNRGTGEQDHQGMMAFEDIPHSINPQQGYVANWNNKPSTGWGDGVGGNAITRPAAPVQRVLNWIDLLDAEDNISYERLIEMNKIAGRLDVRSKDWVPLVAEALEAGALEPPEAALAELIRDWDGHHYNPDIDIFDEEALDRPAETIFEMFIHTLRQLMFVDVLPPDLFDRMSAVGGHEYDASPLDNLALKQLNPSVSSISLRHDYSKGMSSNEWVQLTLLVARQFLELTYASTDPNDFRRIHHREDVCSLTGGIVGPCITMPYEDRGSWNEIIGFTVGD